MLGARGVSDSFGVLICFLPQFWNICIYIMRYLRVGLEYKQEILFGYIHLIYIKGDFIFFYVFVFDEDKPVIGLHSTK